MAMCLTSSRMFTRLATSNTSRAVLCRPIRAANSPANRRFASTSSSAGSGSLLLGRLRVLLYTSSLGITAYVLYLYATDTRASVHQWLVPPLMRIIYPDAEASHHAGISSLQTLASMGLNPRERPRNLNEQGREQSDLAVTVFGNTKLSNPMGISAGLDKDADVPDALFDLGAAVVEVGGCTPRPQDGNPQPRVWRVPALEGMVNRYGLNSRGADAMAAKLRTRLRSWAATNGLTEQEALAGDVAGVPVGSFQDGKLLLVQIAKNKETDERDVNAVARDYVYCVNRLAPYADVLVVNVSSPNTPGLRELQAMGPLTRILSAVVDEAQATPGRKQKPKIMVKVSPDEDDATQIEGIVQAVHVSGVDGVIVGNTTKRREALNPHAALLTVAERKALMETGGYSGPAMFERTLALVGRYRKQLDQVTREASDANGRKLEQKAVFATGGITTGQQALQILNAGANVAMVYTGLIYGGIGTITRMKDQMRVEASKMT